MNQHIFIITRRFNENHSGAGVKNRKINDIQYKQHPIEELQEFWLTAANDNEECAPFLIIPIQKSHFLFLKP